VIGVIVVLRSRDDGGVEGLSSLNGLVFESCSWGRASEAGRTSGRIPGKPKAAEARAHYPHATLSPNPSQRKSPTLDWQAGSIACTPQVPAHWKNFAPAES